jgi:hypothetical protein
METELQTKNPTSDWRGKLRDFFSYLGLDRIFGRKPQISLIENGPFLCRHINVFPHNGFKPTVVNDYTLCEGFKQSSLCRLRASRNAMKYVRRMRVLYSFYVLPPDRRWLPRIALSRHCKVLCPPEPS